MNGFKKNKNQRQNGMSNKSFGKGDTTKQQDSMKKEYGSSQKSTTSGNDMLKKSSPSNGMMKKSSPNNGMAKGTQSQNKSDSNKYFSGSEKKSSSDSKNVSKTSYKKCDYRDDEERRDIEPTKTKKGR